MIRPLTATALHCRHTYWLLAAFLLSTCGAPTVLPAAEDRIQVVRNDELGRLQVNIDGQEAIVYRYGGDVDLPHFYPLRSPTGQSMLVEHPDPYPHHRAFWFADTVQRAGMRQVSFYQSLYSGPDGHRKPGPPFRDHVRHVGFQPGPAAANQIQLQEKLLWEMDHNVPVLDENRLVRIVALEDGQYFMDVTFRVTASYGEVAFVSDRVHYAWPYLRMNQTFSVDGGGTITNSAGGVNQQGTHDKPATWIDYSNTVDGQTSGLTVFSHPDNPQPHLWLTRDYGCFGPRRIAAKSGQRFVLKQGESLRQRVGILVHRGNVEHGRIADHYRAYCEGKL